MSSRIEQLIDEIEDYIDGCKYQPLSKTNIIVNKEEIDELLRELRMKTPDEIKRGSPDAVGLYRGIVENLLCLCGRHPYHLIGLRVCLRGGG